MHITLTLITLTRLNPTRIKIAIQAFSFLVGMLFVSMSRAYIGPGAGISSIGLGLGFLAIILLLIVGFVWYPIKSIFFANKNLDGSTRDEGNEGSDSSLDKGSDKARKF